TSTARTATGCASCAPSATCWASSARCSDMPFAIGIDFGTESARALIVETATGRVAGSATAAYVHGVIDERLPANGRPLGDEWALQHPLDWLDALAAAVRDAMAAAAVGAADVVGIGIDFTACTV